MPSPTDKDALIRLITASGMFNEEWYLATYPDVALSGLGAVEHYLRIGAWLGREPNPNFDTDRYVREHPEISGLDVLPFVHSITKEVPQKAVGTIKTGHDNKVTAKYTPTDYPILSVDEPFYLMHNPDVAASGMSVRKHFDTNGYREMRNPREDFDIWWYTQNYLLGTSDSETNALAHYNKKGAALGYLPRPPLPVTFKTEHSRKLPDTPRRVCLFAAYDADGIVDDYVLAYLRDMAQHADIYYLADCPMDATELTKLDGLVKGAWADRHGMYDFGSYSILARDLVGWEDIETYDEMILANDSCYLVHPLKDTFNTMATRSCAWWGLQATKGMISTQHQNRIAEDVPVPIHDIKENHLDSFESDPIYDFHVGSYFLAFRKSVIKDSSFRRVLDHVSKETSKRNIIRKYEIGLTRFLIGKGYEFDTLVETVSKQHPIFTERAFDLIEGGFPLLKRFFLTDNHYKIKGLEQWKSRIHHANPNVDIRLFEKNLYRVGNALKLYNNFHIGQNPDLSRIPRTDEEMQEQDSITPKYDHWWAFPVCAYSHLFSDNTRAVFERVKNNPAIKKIILTRSNHIEVDGVNVVVLPLHSYEGQTYLLRARHVFLRHGVRANIEYSLSSDEHNFYNLWHGIPLKRIGYTSLDQATQVDKLTVENERLTSVIAASDVDRLAMTAAYYPLTFHDIWVTGLPRHDLILSPEDQLPQDFAGRAAQLRRSLQGRKFVLFAPTFRADQEKGYYRFTEDEVRQLADWLTRNNMAMGIREHMADTARLYSSQLRGECFFDASERHYPDIELLYRHADMLLTDYSSCFIDFMLTGRPMASFAFDYDSYANSQRGLFYDQEMVFPGPVCSSFSDLMQGLEKLLSPISEMEQAAYDWKVSFFHKYRDNHNADRVIEKVVATQTGSKALWPVQTRRATSEKRYITFVYAPRHNITNRYRIFNLVEHLRALGWTCRVVTEDRLTEAHLRAADVMFICRLPMTETLSDYCETFHLQGGKIIYDIDDLIHDMDAFSQSEYFRKRPQFASDFTDLSSRTRQMIETADLVTVTTAALSESVADISAQVEVIPNSISSTLTDRFSASPAPRKGANKVRICYLSGTATHSEDFEECRQALMRVLVRYPQAELHIVGRLDVNEPTGPKVENNIIHHNLMSYDAMHQFLEGMDINLAPLAATFFNDCKSELKIFDAALHGLPSVASPSRSYADTIIHKKTGMLAKTSQEWEEALGLLIEDAALRYKMGRAAFENIVPRFAARKSARALAGAISVLMHKKNPGRISH